MKLSWVHLFLLIFLLPVALVTGWSLHRIDAQNRKTIRSTLQTVLYSTQSALEIWAHDTESEVNFWAEHREVSQTVLKLSRHPHDRALIDRLNREFRPVVTRHEYINYFILSPDGTLLSGGPEGLRGQNGMELLGRGPGETREIQNDTILHLPFYSPIGKVQMAVTAPIRIEGKLIAILGFQLDPTKDFTRTAQLGRVGESGETYAFDRRGKLITESRFDQNLRDMGLIPPGKFGILSIDIRDPGGNMLEGYVPNQPRQEEPLTKMAQSAIAGNTDVNVEGYRDYRGVLVVGAWVWDHELGFGLVTEIDASEAYHTYYVTRNLALFMLLVTVFGAAILSYTIWRQNQRLEEALRVRNDFLSIASHELRTPLASLMPQMELINRAVRTGRLESLPPERLMKLTEISSREIARLAKLVQNLLDVTRIASGRLVLEVEEVDVRKLVKKVVDQLCEQFRSIGCQIHMAEGEEIKAFMDPYRMEQVIINLLTNAMKYGKGNQVEVSLFKDRDFVKIAVRDHGIGISKEDQRKLFERFERIAPPETGGLGLGLYISRQIVEAHRGRIGVESAVGVGSTFTVEIPLSLAKRGPLKFSA